MVGTIIITQLFALPPTPSRLDLFLVLPLYGVSVHVRSRPLAAPGTGPTVSPLDCPRSPLTRLVVLYSYTNSHND